MKRFHVHVSVNNIDESVRFYSKVFGNDPTVRKPDYAKWMIDDPRINFAISTCRAAPGINHLGMQVDSDDELKAMHGQLAAADAALVEEAGANCCYAKSDKYWITDPQGIAWETWHSLGAIPVFGEQAHSREEAPASGCCAGNAAAGVKNVAPTAAAGCCA